MKTSLISRFVKLILLLICIMAILPLWGVTRYFGSIDSETLLSYHKSDSELTITLCNSEKKELFLGKYDYQGSVLVNCDSTETINVDFLAETLDLKIVRNGEEFILKEVAQNLVQSRELNRLSTKIEYPISLSKSDFQKEAEVDYSNFFKQSEEEFWQEGFRYMSNEPKFFIAYDMILDAELELLSSDLISISYVDYRYTGGAHGNHFYDGLNYYWVDGEIEVLRFEDIFSDSKIKNVSDLCIFKLKELGADDVVEGTRTGLSFVDLQAFSFCNAGITFYFPPYMLDCYAAGDFKVLVSWEELRNLIKTDSPLRRFVK